MKERMKKKSWTKEELDKLEYILKQEKKRDLLMKKSFHHFFYWTMISIIIILNFLSLIVILPFLLIVENNSIYLYVGLFSLLIGFMVNYLAFIADNYDIKHHMVNLSIAPVLCIVNYFLVTNLFNFLSTHFNFSPNYDINLIITFFTICFIMPYFVSLIYKKFKK